MKVDFPCEVPGAGVEPACLAAGDFKSVRALGRLYEITAA